MPSSEICSSSLNDEGGLSSHPGDVRYELRRTHGGLRVHDRVLGIDLLRGPSVAVTAHLEYQLLGIAAAILNERVPASALRPVKGALRYQVEHTAARTGPKGESYAAGAFVSDSDQSLLIMLFAITNHATEVHDAAAVQAIDQVCGGLNAINYGWIDPTEEEQRCELKLSIPHWALPASDRRALAAGEEGSWVAKLGTSPAGTPHAWCEVRNMPFEEPKRTA